MLIPKRNVVFLKIKHLSTKILSHFCVVSVLVKILVLKSLFSLCAAIAFLLEIAD